MTSFIHRQKSILVIGGSHPEGLEIVKNLLDDGASVLNFDRHPAPLTHPQLVSMTGDLGSAIDLQDSIELLQSEFTPLTAVVLNADAYNFGVEARDWFLPVPRALAAIRIGLRQSAEALRARGAGGNLIVVLPDSTAGRAEGDQPRDHVLALIDEANADYSHLGIWVSSYSLGPKGQDVGNPSSMQEGAENGIVASLLRSISGPALLPASA